VNDGNVVNEVDLVEGEMDGGDNGRDNGVVTI